MIQVVFDINSQPYVRTTQKQKFFCKRYAKYHKWKITMRKLWAKQNKSLPNELTVTFIIGMPKSWSKKKKMDMNGRYHQQKPDLSNLVKAFEDAIYTDDSCIYKYVEIKKIWGIKNEIILSI